VDMSRLAGPAYASWYDPANGTFTAIPGSPLANTGTRTFTPPGSNSDGDGDWVLVLEATAVPPDTQPPSVPTGLAASDVSSSQITVSWSASTDDIVVAGYQVFRDGAPVRTTAATSYPDTGLAPFTSYSYTVAAFDYANNVSAPSGILVVSTAPPGPIFVQEGYVTPQTPQSLVTATYAAAEAADATHTPDISC